MYIQRASVFTTDPATTVKELQGELKQYTDYYFRRINKFIILTLLGIHQCINHKSVPTSTAVFLTTESGNMYDTETVLNQMYHDHEFPMPINFINTMSNTASFYAAQSIGAESRNLTLSAKAFSFERGLELARCDLELGAVSSLLVGGVDVMTFSLKQLKEKFGSTIDQYTLVEGSAWLYITRDRTGASGEILDIKSFTHREQALAWLEGCPKEKSAIAFSTPLSDSEKACWQQAAGTDTVYEYLAEFGYFDSTAACGIAGFVSGSRKERLIHVNRNSHDCYLLTLLRNF